MTDIKWTDEETAILRKGIDAGLSTMEMTRNINRSPRAIQSKAQREGWRIPASVKWSEAEITLLHTRSRTMGWRDVAAGIKGRTSSACQSQAAKIGVTAKWGMESQRVRVEKWARKTKDPTPYKAKDALGVSYEHARDILRAIGLWTAPKRVVRVAQRRKPRTEGVFVLPKFSATDTCRMSPVFTMPTPTMVSLEDHRAGQCSWPLDTDEGFRMCGAEAFPKRSYCKVHQAAAYCETKP